MIARLKGTLLSTNPPLVLVDVSGIGFEVEVPMSTFYNLPDIGHEVTLLTHFVVREDAQLLYGFLTEAELRAFKLVLKVNGIGAKTALAILSSLPVDTLASAVASQDTGLLTKVPGIGKKTAERLLLELKDKFDGLVVTSAPSARNEIIEALVSLGYSQKEAAKAAQDLPVDISVADGIRAALQSMVK